MDKRTTQEKAVLLGEGNYALTVAAPGYRNYTAPVQIVADTATFHTVLLEPLLPSAPEVPIRQRTDSGAAPTTMHRPVKQVHSAAPPSMEGLDETVSLKPSRLAPEVPQSKSTLETKRTPPRRTAAAAAPTTIHTPGEQSQKSETVELDSELTRWTSIRAGKSKVPFEEHLARYPSGRYADRARGRIAEFDKWASVQNRGDLSALRDFVESFQDGAFVGEAKNQIARLEKEELRGKFSAARRPIGTDLKSLTEYQPWRRDEIQTLKASFKTARSLRREFRQTGPFKFPGKGVSTCLDQPQDVVFGDGPDRILLAALTIPEPCRSSTIGSARKRRVWRICGGFGGGRRRSKRLRRVVTENRSWPYSSGEAAYRNKDLKSLTEYQPWLRPDEIQTLKASFKTARSLRREFRQTGPLQISGNTARVTCSRTTTTEFMDSHRKPRTDTHKVVITLSRKGDSWVIDSIYLDVRFASEAIDD